MKSIIPVRPSLPSFRVICSFLLPSSSDFRPVVFILFSSSSPLFLLFLEDESCSFSSSSVHHSLRSASFRTTVALLLSFSTFPINLLFWKNRSVTGKGKKEAVCVHVCVWVRINIPHTHTKQTERLLCPSAKRSVSVQPSAHSASKQRQSCPPVKLTQTHTPQPTHPHTNWIHSVHQYTISTYWFTQLSKCAHFLWQQHQHPGAEANRLEQKDQTNQKTCDESERSCRLSSGIHTRSSSNSESWRSDG